MSETPDERTPLERRLGADQPALRQLEPSRQAEFIALLDGAADRDRAAAEAELRERLPHLPRGLRLLATATLPRRRR
ncbi:MAG TPA: hypothetical protein VK083_08640 [Nocardia sp.]|uniref:hypothetical protein n=1 Tax=Nocardia sp. TaxID=1821 RepID=UPI002B4B0BB3|nr:hypothetical protein [Nocardia sp.]HLS76839.1 hypothetical protein [Nocardia sp.]